MLLYHANNVMIFASQLDLEILHGSEFSHPAVKLLHWLQASHHANQVRIRQLNDGDPPLVRDLVYVPLDREIAQRKVQFIQERDFLPARQHALGVHAEGYLRFIMHRIG